MGLMSSRSRSAAGQVARETVAGRVHGVRHRTDVRGYGIERTPITNASHLTFAEGGGYERREWWSNEGWSWKEEYDITKRAGWAADRGSALRLRALEPHRPVVHRSWFEADAFVRAHGARLPTELGWEKAATWDQEQDRSRNDRPWPIGAGGGEPRGARAAG
jgi:iron(II)-dependent oxidoreductase